MIRITGDTHGDFTRFGSKFFTASEGDTVIICGDFGGVWRNSPEEKYWLDWLQKKPCTFLFVDGNHENFPEIFRYPNEVWNGGKIHRIRNNVIHLMRGQVFEIEGKTFFTMGGAYSIDKMYRTPGYSYWEEELPNGEEYREAAANLEKCGKKVDYIITHTAPREIIRMMGCNPHENDMELTGFLEWVMYETDFKKWYFGHWHTDKRVTEKFRAIYLDVENAE